MLKEWGLAHHQGSLDWQPASLPTTVGCGTNFLFFYFLEGLLELGIRKIAINAFILFQIKVY